MKLLKLALATVSLLAALAVSAPVSGAGKDKLEKAPEFALKDQQGKTRKLSDLLKKGRVALIFYRSASW